MPRRALYDKRPWLFLSIVAALAFYFLREGQLGDIYLVPVKGTAVGLLAVYAWLRHRSNDAHLIAGVMVAAALGDMAMEFDDRVGGLLFLASQIGALSLYLQPHNRRVRPTASQKGAAAALLLGSPLLAFLLTRDLGAVVYGVTLGGMAGAAWMSRFSRYHVGIGAVMFVASDMLIFARMGQHDIEPWGDLLIWPLYYLGQFLICTGVVQTLRRDHQA